ncbi:hypothetical protein PFMC_06020 [Plasmodium falciparum CAMP/Malaysia]|uniref:3-oxoacyl-[acyl-carrier-protein] reductase n=1 Tax=Plasmodium falciparum (isolate Camp / Malaysia) TaxID=5835 RepID=A0A024WYY3_PLAFC|nr:hypothetical protein PFMC_06020 [Plasmodium falciparum CAMP/Malaysia]
MISIQTVHSTNKINFLIKGKFIKNNEKEVLLAAKDCYLELLTSNYGESIYVQNTFLKIIFLQVVKSKHFDRFIVVDEKLNVRILEYDNGFIEYYFIDNLFVENLKLYKEYLKSTKTESTCFIIEEDYHKYINICNINDIFFISIENILFIRQVHPNIYYNNCLSDVHEKNDRSKFEVLKNDNEKDKLIIKHPFFLKNYKNDSSLQYEQNNDTDKFEVNKINSFSLSHDKKKTIKQKKNMFYVEPNKLMEDNSFKSCDSVVDEIKSFGYESSGYAGDVSKKEEISEVINKILTEHKNVDILVNNAGITRDNLFLRMKNDEWEDVLRTNLNSLFYITQPISKRMINNRYGRIINISSIVGLTGNVGQANYSSSKAGVIGFTKSLAKELASRNITVNAIAPGFISSDMTDKISEQIKKNIISNIPAGRMGTPEEVYKK